MTPAPTPTQEANNPQACIRHLRTELTEYEHAAAEHAARAGGLASQLAVCRASLNARNDEFDATLALMREGRRQRELAETERDKLRELLKKVGLVLRHPGCRDEVPVLQQVQAVLEPNPETKSEDADATDGGSMTPPVVTEDMGHGRDS